MSPASPASPPECTVGGYVRGDGRVILEVQVPSLSPWRVYDRGDVRLWMRWAEPGETGSDAPKLELAAATRSDEETGTAWVLARCPLRAEREFRVLYRCAEAQGVAELFVFECSGFVGQSPQCMRWVACADLTRRCEEFGISTDGFPRFYRYR